MAFIYFAADWHFYNVFYKFISALVQNLAPFARQEIDFDLWIFCCSNVSSMKFRQLKLPFVSVTLLLAALPLQLIEACRVLHKARQIAKPRSLPSFGVWSSWNAWSPMRHSLRAWHGGADSTMFEPALSRTSI